MQIAIGWTVSKVIAPIVGTSMSLDTQSDPTMPIISLDYQSVMDLEAIHLKTFELFLDFLRVFLNESFHDMLGSQRNVHLCFSSWSCPNFCI